MDGVNRLVVRNGNEYINGSTVFAPEVDRNNPLRKEEYEKLRKANIERSNRAKQKKNTKKRKIMLNIFLVFLTGLGLIWSEARVYNTQKDLSKIKKEIHDVQQSNEALKIELVKVSGIEIVKSTAENNLHMINPDRKQAIYMDLSKDNFAEAPKDDREGKTKEIISKIKNLLF